MKKILLLDTSIATQNIGDEIINDSIQHNWKDLFDKNYIYRFPTHTPPYSWWQQLFCSKKIEQQKDVDYKFLCGTNALYTNMVRPWPQWNVHFWNSGFLKDTILLGVGAGINSKKINFYTRHLYYRILSHKFIHSVRDEFTKEMLIKLGFKAYNTGCPTMWGFTTDFCKNIPTVKAKDVIFTLTGYQPDIKSDRLMIDILRKNYDKLFFWPQTYLDVDYLKSLGNYGVTIVTPNLASYDKILETDIDYVGNRLHGGIRALQHKKRTIIISIDYRAENMSDRFSLPTLKREDMMQLDKTIISPFQTRINGLNWEEIEAWKKQFLF